jgi:hypothetical protein
MFLSLVKRRVVPTQLGPLEIVTVSADDVNLLGEDKYHKGKQTLLNASKSTGLETDQRKLNTCYFSSPDYETKS